MSVIEYYNNIATNYDSSRFSNSYGKYIDSSEKVILDLWLKNTDIHSVIDLGCGTGRLLNYAMTGLDGSEKMLEIAASKFPNHALHKADITQIPENITGFDVGICFHVLMHLDRNSVHDFFTNTSKVINPNGKLIVDFLSAPRRRFLNHAKTGWHGNTDFSISDITNIIQPIWKITRWHGIVMLPIHKLPSAFRHHLVKLDLLLCKLPLSPYASYYIVEMKKVK